MLSQERYSELMHMNTLNKVYLFISFSLNIYNFLKIELTLLINIYKKFSLVIFFSVRDQPQCENDNTG